MILTKKKPRNNNSQDTEADLNTGASSAGGVDSNIINVRASRAQSLTLSDNESGLEQPDD